MQCYAASVSGTASAWDRACELYAQLTGTVVDYGEAHSERYGLVNTVSALAPSSAPSTVFNESDVVKGVWNIMPVYRGDHMSLQGGMTKVNSAIYGYYVNHLNMINCL